MQLEARTISAQEEWHWDQAGTKMPRVCLGHREEASLASQLEKRKPGAAMRPLGQKPSLALIVGDLEQVLRSPA